MNESEAPESTRDTRESLGKVSEDSDSIKESEDPESTRDLRIMSGINSEVSEGISESWS